MERVTIATTTTTTTSHNNNKATNYHWTGSFQGYPLPSGRSGNQKCCSLFFWALFFFLFLFSFLQWKTEDHHHPDNTTERTTCVLKLVPQSTEKHTHPHNSSSRHRLLLVVLFDFFPTGSDERFDTTSYRCFNTLASSIQGPVKVTTKCHERVLACFAYRWASFHWPLFWVNGRGLSWVYWYTHTARKEWEKNILHNFDSASFLFFKRYLIADANEKGHRELPELNILYVHHFCYPFRYAITLFTVVTQVLINTHTHKHHE